MKNSNTWVLNKRTGKYEQKPDTYKPPPMKVKIKPPKRSHHKKVDKKTATAFYGSKQMDLQILKKSRNVN